MEEAEINTFINGPESFTTDNQYILGEAPECRGFFVAAGGGKREARKGRAFETSWEREGEAPSRW